jgi:uncharacterized cupin superfamily protein
MAGPIINIADLEFRPWGHGTMLPGQKTEASPQFAARLGAISARVGAQKLGYNLTVIPVGKRAFPRHNHHVNEEMFFVLEGTGEVRIGDRTYPLRAGDVVACPPGGTETAHHIVNTGTAELKFLAVSTMMSPDIADYPDSGKFGVLELVGGVDPEGRPRGRRFIGRRETSGDYWEGE